MEIKLNKIYEIDDLGELEKFLATYKDVEKLREALFTEFLKYADYKNVSDWNKSVRLCESLTIIGWGNYEALEALKGKFFNGNPATKYVNKFGESRFVDAIWSKRKAGFTMEQGRTSYHFSPNQLDDKKTILWDYETKEDIQDIKMESQRNWIPKTPIRIGRYIQNCYDSSLQLAEEIETELKEMLDAKMKPESYGTAVNRLDIKLSFSYANYNKFGEYTAFVQANYIIADERLKLKEKDFNSELKKIFSKEEINQNGYYLTNRFKISPFRSKTGKQTMQIYLEKEFSELSYLEQKEKILKYIIEILERTISKLKKKKLDYDFDLMFNDFKEIIYEWKKI